MERSTARGGRSTGSSNPTAAKYRRTVQPDPATTPAIVHVVGYQGVDMYTVARELADVASADGSRVSSLPAREAEALILEQHGSLPG